MKPFRRAGRGEEALPEIWVELGGPLVGLGGVGRLFWTAGGSGGTAGRREATPEVRQWSGGAPGGLAVVRRLCCLAGTGRETLLEGQQGS